MPDSYIFSGKQPVLFPRGIILYCFSSFDICFPLSGCSFFCSNLLFFSPMVFLFSFISLCVSVHTFCFLSLSISTFYRTLFYFKYYKSYLFDVFHWSFSFLFSHSALISQALMSNILDIRFSIHRLSTVNRIFAIRFRHLLITE